MENYIKVLESIFDTIQEGLLLLDRDFKILLCNKKFLEIFNAKRLDILGKNIFTIKNGEFDIPEFKEMLLKILPEKTYIENYEIKKHFKNIGEKIIILNVRSISADNSQYILIAIHDVTDIRKEEEEKKILEKQMIIAQRLDSISKISAGLIHDFNNLLGAIIGYAELSLSKLSEDHPVYENMFKIIELCQRASSLSKRLITFAKQAETQPKYLNLNQVISDTLNLLKKILGENIKVEFAPDLNLKSVYLDPVQFEQVLVNLCLNARDAMPEGGYLFIETKNVYLDRNYLKTHYHAKQGEYVMLAISDTGCGIPEEHIPHIFEPFYTTKEKGTGLGLSVVHGIIHKHNGFINVYSEEGKGTTFKIYLPARDEIPIEYKIRREYAELAGGETILVVEDDDDLREIIKWILENFGYIVITARNGNEGLNIYKKNISKINLILTDVFMPEMGGKELYSEVKKLTPETKFLFMSGYTENMIKNNFFLDPEINTITKPFTALELARKIREILKS